MSGHEPMILVIAPVGLQNERGELTKPSLATLFACAMWDERSDLDPGIRPVFLDSAD
jgi:hypothetical protein